MTFSRFYNYKELYIRYIPIIIPFTGTIGFFTGLNANIKHAPTPFDNFINIVGYTSIGITCGAFYPISFPLLGYYAVHKNK